MTNIKKASSTDIAIGVVSSMSTSTLMANGIPGIPVLSSGKVIIKVTNENGAIKVGDYLTVSKNIPGYAMKLTGEGKTIGRALSDYVDGKDKVLALIETGYKKLDMDSTYASTTAMLTTGNVDLNANGVAIYNLKSLASANGSWSIDANGRITGKQLCVEEVCIDKATLKALLNNANLNSTLNTNSISTNEGGSSGGNSTTTETTNTSTSTVETNATTTVSTSTSPDTVAPVITLNGPASVTLTQGSVYTEEGATSTDNVDTNVQVNLSGSVDTGTAGTYTITYTATDTAGNTATATREVIVTSPVVVTPPVVEPTPEPTPVEPTP
jgi:hypothetical protein